jgi:hypothetical protein
LAQPPRRRPNWLGFARPNSPPGVAQLLPCAAFHCRPVAQACQPKTARVSSLICGPAWSATTFARYFFLTAACVRGSRISVTKKSWDPGLLFPCHYKRPRQPFLPLAHLILVLEGATKRNTGKRKSRGEITRGSGRHHGSHPWATPRPDRCSRRVAGCYRSCVWPRHA